MCKEDIYVSNKAIKYRIFPTEEQTIFFGKTFGCCRKVWNLMLSDIKQYYQENQKMLNVTPAQYKNDYPYLKEVDSLALANVQRFLKTAFKRFFDDISEFPKFKAKHISKKSYTTNNQNGTVAIIGDTIKLPKVGRVKAKIHRLPKDSWKLKSATISCEGDGKYYASVLFEYENVIVPITPSKEKVVGLDYSTKFLFINNDGEKGNIPKWYKDAYKKIAKAQRQLAKMIGSKKGEPKSKNWIKQKEKIARLYKKVANQRKDFLHKMSTEIANLYDVIGIEDISIKEIIQEREFKAFRKATYNNGWYGFTQMLKYKMQDRGKYLIKCDKEFPSTQKCNCCGYINAELTDDSIRKWECPSCGTQHDRDVNAAINIKREAIRIVFG